MTETTRMLTPKDVAGILGVHQKTVHLWLRNGRLKGIKISYRAWRIPQSALDRFMEQNSNVPLQNSAKGPATGAEGQRSDNTGHEPAIAVHDVQQIKMKQYLQEIMAEQAPENDRKTQ